LVIRHDSLNRGRSHGRGRFDHWSRNLGNGNGCRRAFTENRNDIYIHIHIIRTIGRSGNRCLAIGSGRCAIAFAITASTSPVAATPAATAAGAFFAGACQLATQMRFSSFHLTIPCSTFGTHVGWFIVVSRCLASLAFGTWLTIFATTTTTTAATAAAALAARIAILVQFNRPG
jgi:hypothetical protein